MLRVSALIVGFDDVYHNSAEWYVADIVSSALPTPFARFAVPGGSSCRRRAEPASVPRPPARSPAHPVTATSTAPSTNQ